jgi:hypothetical protein
MSVLSVSGEQRAVKLRKLCEIEGFEDENVLFAAAEMEPDQHRGWCEECQRPTMVSALVLGGCHCRSDSPQKRRLNIPQV